MSQPDDVGRLPGGGTHDALGNEAFALFWVEFTTETQLEPLAPQTTRYEKVRF
jgi:hypothetical protein